MFGNDPVEWRKNATPANRPPSRHATRAMLDTVSFHSDGNPSPTRPVAGTYRIVPASPSF